MFQGSEIPVENSFTEITKDNNQSIPGEIISEEKIDKQFFNEKDYKFLGEKGENDEIYHLYEIYIRNPLGKEHDNFDTRKVTVKVKKSVIEEEAKHISEARRLGSDGQWNDAKNDWDTATQQVLQRIKDIEFRKRKENLNI